MTTQNYIIRAVDNEFEKTYTRNLCKAYLLTDLLNLTQREIGYILIVDRRRVGDYLFHMKVFNQGSCNPFLKERFAPKFPEIQKACEKYATDNNFRKHLKVLDNAKSRVSAKRVSLLNEWQKN
jgi:hypothetical protein